MAYATAADVAAGWRPLTTAEQAVATVLLDRAAAMIHAQVPSVPYRLLAGTLDAKVPAAVSCNMVQRLLRNPAGVAQQALGPASVTWTKTDTGLLFLSAEDLAALVPVDGVGAASVGAGSVALASWNTTVVPVWAQPWRYPRDPTGGRW